MNTNFMRSFEEHVIQKQENNEGIRLRLTIKYSLRSIPTRANNRKPVKQIYSVSIFA